MTQLADQVKIVLTSQLIKDISRVPQKLLKYFNGTIISTFIIPLLSVWPVNFVSKSNESVALAPLKSTILPIVIYNWYIFAILQTLQQ